MPLSRNYDGYDAFDCSTISTTRHESSDIILQEQISEKHLTTVRIGIQILRSSGIEKEVIF